MAVIKREVDDCPTVMIIVYMPGHQTADHQQKHRRLRQCWSSHGVIVKRSDKGRVLGGTVGGVDMVRGLWQV